MILGIHKLAIIHVLATFFRVTSESTDFSIPNTLANARAVMGSFLAAGVVEALN
jgi:hypothetical protein